MDGSDEAFFLVTPWPNTDRSGGVTMDDSSRSLSIELSRTFWHPARSSPNLIHNGIFGRLSSHEGTTPAFVRDDCLGQDGTSAFRDGMGLWEVPNLPPIGS